jgi:hypothetical protein
MGLSRARPGARTLVTPTRADLVACRALKPRNTRWVEVAAASNSARRRDRARSMATRKGGRMNTMERPI